MATVTVNAVNIQALDVSAASGNTPDLDVRTGINALFITQLATLTGGTAPTVQFIVEWKDAAGVYRAIATHTTLSAAGTKTTAMGTGVSAATGVDILWPVPFGTIIRVRWVTTGGPATATANIVMIMDIF